MDLEHGVASLYPLQPGRVAEVLVAENQEVAQGAELLRLEDGIARSRLAEAEAAVVLAQLQLRQARKQPELHRRRVAQQQAMRDAMDSRVAAARHVLAREEKLAKSAVITESDRSISEEKIRELEALERAEAAATGRAGGPGCRGRDPSRRVRAEGGRGPPRTGAAGPGGMPREGPAARHRPPHPGRHRATCWAASRVSRPCCSPPLGPQVIRATVEQEFASRVKEGEPALVQDEADPSAAWRGRVERVAGWYSQRRTVLHDPSQLSDVRTLECVIVLEPGQPRLRLGQSVRIFIGPVPP